MRQSLLNEASTIVHFLRWSLSQLSFYWRISDSPDKGRGGEEFDKTKKSRSFFHREISQEQNVSKSMLNFFFVPSTTQKESRGEVGTTKLEGLPQMNFLRSLGFFSPCSSDGLSLVDLSLFLGPLQMCAITYSILSFTRSVYPWELRCSSKNNNVVCGWSLKCHRSRGRVWWWERCDGGPKTAGRPNCTEVVCRYILQGWDTSARWGLKFQYRWRWDG